VLALLRRLQRRWKLAILLHHAQPGVLQCDVGARVVMRDGRSRPGSAEATFSKSADPYLYRN